MRKFSLATRTSKNILKHCIAKKHTSCNIFILDRPYRTLLIEQNCICEYAIAGVSLYYVAVFNVFVQVYL